MKKLDYTIIISLAIAVVSWGVSVESRFSKYEEALNLSNRVRAMEELLLPMLIDWKTHKEVKKWQEENIKKIEKEVGKSDLKPKIAPSLVPVFEEEVPPVVKKKVDEWAKGIVESQKESKSP
jgi:hypothetical protein